MMATTFDINMELIKHKTYMRGWSLTDLARRANLSLNTIFALQVKRRRASERTVYKLANALDVSPAEIIEKSYELQKKD